MSKKNTINDRANNAEADAEFEAGIEVSDLFTKHLSNTPKEARDLIQKHSAEHGVEPLNNIHPIAFAVNSIGDNGQPLIDRSIEITPIVNPLFDARMLSLGMQRIGTRTYTIGVGQDGSFSSLINVIKSLDPAMTIPAIIANKYNRGGISDGSYSQAHIVHKTIQKSPLGSMVSWYKFLDNFYNHDSYGKNYGRVRGCREPEMRHRENGLIAVSSSNTQLYVKVMTSFSKDRVLDYEEISVERSIWNHATKQQESTQVKAKKPLPSKGYKLWKDAPDLNTMLFSRIADPLRVSPPTAVALIEQIDKYGFSVYGSEALEGFAAQTFEVAIAERKHGSPGIGQLFIGKNVFNKMPKKIVDRIGEKFSAPVDTYAGEDPKEAPYRYCEMPASEIDFIVKELKASRGRKSISKDKIVVDDYLTDIVNMLNPSDNKHDRLRPYQNEMVNLHLSTDIGVVNACSPGTGKTPTTLTGFRVAADNKKGYRALAVVPASVRSQWLEEAETWFKAYLPNAKVANFTPAQMKKSYADWIDEAGDNPTLTVLSYQQATSSIEALSVCEYDDIVCDEAAILANRSSKRTKALWELRKNCKRAVATTGTPIGSTLDSLGNIIAWTRNEKDAFYGKKGLSKRFDMSVDGDDLRMIEVLGPTLFRRDASVIRDQMPHIDNSVVLLDPHTSEKSLADGARDELKKIIKQLDVQKSLIERFQSDENAQSKASEELQKIRGALLGGVTIARKAASDPEALVDSDSLAVQVLKDNGMLDKAIKQGGTKRKYVEQLTVDLVDNDEAVLIFSDFTSVAEKLAEGLKSKGIKVGTWFGNNIKQRELDKKDFMDGKLDVMILTGAGREGLNLQRASALIHYDLPWVPTQVVQRVGRAARFGSTTDRLKIISPVMKGTIEERVATVLVPRAVEALIALDRHRGVSGSETDIGQAVGGLDAAITSKTKAESNKQGLIDLANEILSS